MKIQDSSTRSGLIRAVVAVCLLAGVFAMHGLTGNHDAAALTHAAQPPAAALQSMHQATQPPAGHAAHHLSDGPSVTAGSLGSAAYEAVILSGVTVQPAQDGHGHAMGDVCLAMLTALALVIVAALASRSLRTTHPVVRRRAGRTWYAAGPSPPWAQPTLSKLCILRT
ncbi:hypothetical protein [Kribbella swartbergensis]